MHATKQLSCMKRHDVTFLFFYLSKDSSFMFSTNGEILICAFSFVFLCYVLKKHAMLFKNIWPSLNFYCIIVEQNDSSLSLTVLSKSITDRKTDCSISYKIFYLKVVLLTYTFPLLFFCWIKLLFAWWNSQYKLQEASAMFR